MSKLISITKSVPRKFLNFLVRSGAPRGKVTTQRHGTAGDSDLRLDSRDLSSPGPSLQLLDAVGVHPETAAAAADVAAAG